MAAAHPAARPHAPCRRLAHPAAAAAAAFPSPRPQDVISSSELLRSIANSGVGLSHPAAVALKWVEVPLGSVRVSLGWWSTFDDVYALADFIERTYKDRHE
jgi:selenocysteine lyase/cysteine desulfurase